MPSLRVFHDRSQRRTVQVIEMSMRNHDQINRRQIANPQTWLAQSFSTNSQRAKLGSNTTFCPPICTKKLACPMKVTPSSPFEISFGL